MPSKRKVVAAAEEVMGVSGPAFIKHQMERCGIKNDPISPEDMSRLVKEAHDNAILLIGSTQASKLKSRLERIK